MCRAGEAGGGRGREHKKTCNIKPPIYTDRPLRCVGKTGVKLNKLFSCASYGGCVHACTRLVGVGGACCVPSCVPDKFQRAGGRHSRGGGAGTVCHRGFPTSSSTQLHIYAHTQRERLIHIRAPFPAQSIFFLSGPSVPRWEKREIK